MFVKGQRISRSAGSVYWMRGYIFLHPSSNLKKVCGGIGPKSNPGPEPIFTAALETAVFWLGEKISFIQICGLLLVAVVG
jgi:hypothetical protein